MNETARTAKTNPIIYILATASCIAQHSPSCWLSHSVRTASFTLAHCFSQTPSWTLKPPYKWKGRDESNNSRHTKMHFPNENSKQNIWGRDREGFWFLFSNENSKHKPQTLSIPKAFSTKILWMQRKKKNYLTIFTIQIHNLNTKLKEL